jgi:hypothetical protein
MDLQPHRAPGGLRLSHLNIRASGIRPIDEDGDASHCGTSSRREFEPLDLPVVQSMPPALLARADEVIE